MPYENNETPQGLRHCSSRAIIHLFLYTVVFSLPIWCGKSETHAEAVVTTKINTPGRPSPTAAVSLPAPFGRHTDDLDGMVKRENIRAGDDQSH